jgi:hypothetical protein
VDVRVIRATFVMAVAGAILNHLFNATAPFASAFAIEGTSKTPTIARHIKNLFLNVIVLILLKG